MSSIFDKVQPAVKKETRRVVMITAVGLVLMWILFAGLHFAMPDKVPLDYTVFLGGIGGGLIAVLNFFLMGLAVQKAASATDEGTARMKLKASYSQRFLMMMLWVIAVIRLRFSMTKENRLQQTATRQDIRDMFLRSTSSSSSSNS